MLKVMTRYVLRGSSVAPGIGVRRKATGKGPGRGRGRPPRGGPRGAEERRYAPARDRTREDQSARREAQRCEDHAELRAPRRLRSKPEPARERDLSSVRPAGLRNQEEGRQREERDRSAETGTRPRALSAERRDA